MAVPDPGPDPVGGARPIVLQGPAYVPSLTLPVPILCMRAFASGPELRIHACTEDSPSRGRDGLPSAPRNSIATVNFANKTEIFPRFVQIHLRYTVYSK
jgi:hypothetical protein